MVVMMRRPPTGTSESEEEGQECCEVITSANLCRWIIDFKEVQLGNQMVGLGSYGVVFKGKWKGIEVAVKKFIKQKLDERTLLALRAEMGILSEIHHPNVVLFIGACIRQPNLAIITEFVQHGSLKDVLSNLAIKLSWKQRMAMLHSAARGIYYLHSLEPAIVHRYIYLCQGQAYLRETDKI